MASGVDLVYTNRLRCIALKLHFHDVARLIYPCLFAKIGSGFVLLKWGFVAAEEKQDYCSCAINFVASNTTPTPSSVDRQYLSRIYPFEKQIAITGKAPL